MRHSRKFQNPLAGSDHRSFGKNALVHSCMVETVVSVVSSTVVWLRQLYRPRLYGWDSCISCIVHSCMVETVVSVVSSTVVSMTSIKKKNIYLVNIVILKCARPHLGRTCSFTVRALYQPTSSGIFVVRAAASGVFVVGATLHGAEARLFLSGTFTSIFAYFRIFVSHFS